MTQLAASDTSFTVAGLDRCNEVGAIARGVELFRHNRAERLRLKRKKHAAERRAQEERRAIGRGIDRPDPAEGFSS